MAGSSGYYGSGRLSEDLRIQLWMEYGVAYDAHMNLISRLDEDNYINLRYRDGLMMRLDNCPRRHRFWRMVYPGCNPLIGRSAQWQRAMILGSSVAVGYDTPLGRAIITLQRRIRYHAKARRARKAITHMICQWRKDISEAIAGHIAAHFITMYPRAA